MSGSFIPSCAAVLLPEKRFDAMIAAVGQRVSWMRSHACPCTYSQTTQLNRLSFPGSAQRACTRCLGLGTYWDAPSVPFIAYMSFIHQQASPDEPGAQMNEQMGPVQRADPTLTIAYLNPNLDVADPAQPTLAWLYASVDDAFIPIDMIARFTAVLQVGGLTNLPYQQGLQIAAEGAVTIWDPNTLGVEFVTDYTINGPSVTITGYPAGTNYMVEFLAAPFFIAWSKAGAVPHVRPFGGREAPINEPRRLKLQALDLWTRQRGIQANAAGGLAISAGGTAYALPIPHAAVP